MTISRSINSEINLLLIRYEAVITFDDMKENMEIATGLIEANHELRTLIIFNDNTDMALISGDDLITLTTHSPLLKTKHSNIIVASDKLLFGLSRLFASYGTANDQELKVVTTTDEACQLMNITQKQLDQATPAVNQSYY